MDNHFAGLGAPKAKKDLPVAAKKDEMEVYMAEIKHVRAVASRPTKMIYRAGMAPSWADDDDEDGGNLLAARERMVAKRKVQDAKDREGQRKIAAAVIVEGLKDEAPDSEDEDEKEKVKLEESHRAPVVVDVTKLEVPDALSEASDSDDDEIARRRARARAKAKQRAVAEEEKEEPLQAEEEESDEESESESEEEYEALSRPMLKPIFVTRGKRATVQERERLEEEEAKMEEDKELAREERKVQTQKLVETLKMEDALKIARLAEGGDEEELPATDDEDDDVLLSAWKVRELTRIKRDKENRDKWVEESKETERRRNMTDAEIAAEDARLGLGKKEERGKMRFLQKYYHPGAFYQGTYDDVQKRDFAEATGEDRTVDRTLLPKVLQVKKFGLKGRTKYTHLVDQDTTRRDDNIFLTAEKHVGTVSNHRLAGTGPLDRPLKKRRRAQPQS